MIDIKIVSGLNYGDESKGLVANAVSTPYSLTVFASNSSQRAHTVVYNGIRRVFRHFGSATLKGSPTYYARNFLVNPSMFRKEYNELLDMGITPRVYCNSSCRIVTAADMFNNVMFEKHRKSYGGDVSTCGCGVWAAMCRDIKAPLNIWGYRDNPLQMVNCTVKKCKEVLEKSFSYTYKKVKTNIKDSVDSFYNGKYLVGNIVDDIEFFLNHVTIIGTVAKEKELLRGFPLIVFENSQGLLLDTEYNDDPDHSTPDHIGAMRPYNIITGNFDNDEISLENIYVTRTYFTRHGKGEIGNGNCECDPEDLGIHTEDKTNVYNKHQGFLRYGRIERDDGTALFERMIDDNKCFEWVGYPHELSVVFTHTNEVPVGESLLLPLEQNRKMGEHINSYYSDNESDVYLF